MTKGSIILDSELLEWIRGIAIAIVGRWKDADHQWFVTKP